MAAQAEGVPKGLWIKCNACREILYHREVEANLDVCPRCNYHFRISASRRLDLLFDNRRYKKFFGRIRSADPLKFTDSKPYGDRLKVYNRKFPNSDGIVVAQGEIEKRCAMVAAMEYGFMGGSMGSAVGEKIARAIERCLDRKLPLVVVSASGGARMQEGILSLMQMAKISAGLARMRDRRLAYISILTDPTTGGVTASYAMLGDVNVAEPKALIGFAGPRVIEQTTGQKLPEGFQRSEFLLEHGMIDLIVSRDEMKETLVRLFRLLG